MAKKRASDALLREIRAYGLALPGAHTKSPWPGHLDLAVNDKTFAYLSLEGEPLSVGCKLPHSAQLALELPFCKPMPYGLGKSGWVSASFPDDKRLPSFEMLQQWIDESYRAQAPKKLLGGGLGPRASGLGPKKQKETQKEKGLGPRASGVGGKKKRARKRVS